MCGIAGIYDPENQADYKKLVEDMIGTMPHRGPDGTGFFHTEGVSLGHARLAIIDLTDAANQPFLSEDGKYAFVFNGEIFNFKELKEELLEEFEDLSFKTQSDTEVFFQGLIHHGPEFVQRVRGFYAFAFYNIETHRMWLGRDPMGIKPLYYCIGEKGETYFASEMKALKPFHNKDVRQDGFSEYLIYQSTLPGRNIFQNIREVEPSTVVKLMVKEFKMTKHWCPEHYVARRIRSTKTKDILLQAVERRLVSDVPVATFLSGGLDSSILTAIQRNYLDHTPITYSVVFEEADYNEESYSDLIAKQFKTDHHKIVLSEEEIVKDIQEAWKVQDNPSADGANMYIICKAVQSAGIKVAMSGVGADELFGGYTFYDRIPNLMTWNLWSTYAARLFPEFIHQILPYKLSRTLERFKTFEPSNVKSYYKGLKFTFSPRELKALGVEYRELRPIVEKQYGDIMSLITQVDLENYTTPVLVKDMDQMSMVHSLELREPFLDLDLVEHVLKLPRKMKKKRKYRKQMLIDMFKDDIPEEIYARKKMGFTFPWGVWLRSHLKEPALEALEGLKARDFPTKSLSEIKLNPKYIDQLAKDFFSGKRNNYAHILLLVQLELFFRQYLEE